MNKKQKQKQKQKQNFIIKKICYDIFNINSKLFIKKYLISLKQKYNKEIIKLVSDYIDLLQFKSLFRNVYYDQEYKNLLKILPSNKNLNKYKKVVSMLIEYIINNNFDKFYKFLMEYLKEKNRIFSFYEICKLNPELFSSIKSWYIFGCPLSTDVDICVIVNKKHEGIPVCPNYYSLKKFATQLLNNEITNSDLDFNFITIDENEKRVTSMKKGHEEIANILCFTYKYHNQIYPLPNIDSNVKVDYLDKMRSIGKLIVDNLEFLISKDEYKLLREKKKKVYTKGVFDIIEFSFDCFENIVFINEKIQKDFLKKLVMKIIQLLLSYNNVYEYTKQGLAKLIAIQYKQEIYEKYALYYLTRGKFKSEFENNNFIKLLFNDFKEKYYDYKTVFNNRKHLIIDKNDLLKIPIYNLPKNLYKQFLCSPNELQDKFEKDYKTLYSDSSINHICNERYVINNEFVKFCKENALDKQIYFLKQRTNEWFELLNNYSCGKNSVEIGNDLKDRYHLLRGIIGEYIIQHKINYILQEIGYKNYKFVDIGMIVEEKNTKNVTNTKKYKGTSPDGLLWNNKNNNIGFIEIKCLKNDSIGGNYFRELNLSYLQLQREKEILNYDKTVLLISLLCWFKNEDLCIDIFINNV